eukprot:366113-Chlamydomonas_euryale.AAC.9
MAAWSKKHACGFGFIAAAACVALLRLTCMHVRACAASVLIAAAITTGTKLIDSAADFVPQSVPRSVAKGGVALLGFVFVFGLIQKVRWRWRQSLLINCVISGFVTLAVLLGIGYWYVTRNDDDDGGDSGKRSSSDEDLSDPLSDARRIMELVIDAFLAGYSIPAHGASAYALFASPSCHPHFPDWLHPVCTCAGINTSDLGSNGKLNITNTAM